MSGTDGWWHDWIKWLFFPPARLRPVLPHSGDDGERTADGRFGYLFCVFVCGLLRPLSWVRLPNVSSQFGYLHRHVPFSKGTKREKGERRNGTHTRGCTSWHTTTFFDLEVIFEVERLISLFSPGDGRSFLSPLPITSKKRERTPTRGSCQGSVYDVPPPLRPSILRLSLG